MNIFMKKRWAIKTIKNGNFGMVVGGGVKEQRQDESSPAIKVAAAVFMASSLPFI